MGFFCMRKGTFQDLQMGLIIPLHMVPLVSKCSVLYFAASHSFYEVLYYKHLYFKALLAAPVVSP